MRVDLLPNEDIGHKLRASTARRSPENSCKAQSRRRVWDDAEPRSQAASRTKFQTAPIPTALRPELGAHLVPRQTGTAPYLARWRETTLRRCGLVRPRRPLNYMVAAHRKFTATWPVVRGRKTSLRCSHPSTTANSWRRTRATVVGVLRRGISVRASAPALRTRAGRVVSESAARPLEVKSSSSVEVSQARVGCGFQKHGAERLLTTTTKFEPHGSTVSCKYLKSQEKLMEQKGFEPVAGLWNKRFFRPWRCLKGPWEGKLSHGGTIENTASPSARPLCDPSKWGKWQRSRSGLMSTRPANTPHPQPDLRNLP